METKDTKSALKASNSKILAILGTATSAVSDAIAVEFETDRKD
jgi:hypothetical protein